MVALPVINGMEQNLQCNSKETIITHFWYVSCVCAETPEPPKSCELRNDTTLEVICVPGFDGGLLQHFLLEVVGGNPIYSTETTRDQDVDNEVSTMNDQVSVSYPPHSQNLAGNVCCLI